MDKLAQLNLWNQSRSTFIDSNFMIEETSYSKTNDSSCVGEEITQEEKFLQQKSKALSPLLFDESIILPDIIFIPPSILKAPLVICHNTTLSKISDLSL